VKITIGYHEIEGKRIALKRPLAILERRPAQAAAAATADEQGFAVVGVVRHRFLFKGRPRALITKPGEARQTMAAKNRQQQREEAAAAGDGGGEPAAPPVVAG
jgi:chromosome transmission fidelity protein 8